MAESTIIGGNHLSPGQVDRGFITLTDNPPVSGTIYQNTSRQNFIIYLPAYATTSGTAGNVLVKIGPTSPPSVTLMNQYIGPSTGTGINDSIHFHVPIEWHWQVTLTNATLEAAVAIIY